MATNVGTLLVNLDANTAKFARGMDQANRKMDAFGRNAKKAKKAAIGLAGTLLGVGLVKGMSQTGDQTAKMARELNLATGQLVNLTTAAERLSGLTRGEFNKSLERMVRNIGELADGTGTAKDAFGLLGISFSEIERLSADEQFLLIVSRINEMDSATRQASAAYDIFGRQGQKLLTTIRAGSNEIENIANATDKLTNIVSDNDLAQIEELNDAWADVFLGFQSIGLKLFSDISGGLTRLAKGIEEYIIPTFGNLTLVIGSSFKGLEALGILLTGGELSEAAAVAQVGLDNLAKVWERLTGATDDATNSTKKAAKTFQTMSLPTMTITGDPGFEKDFADAKSVVEEMLTPLEVYEKKLLRLNELWQKQGDVLTTEVYGKAIIDAQNEFLESSRATATEWSNLWQSTLDRFAAGVGDAVADSILEQENLNDAMKAVARDVLRQVISTLVEIGVKRAILFAQEQAQLAATTATVVASNTAIATSAAPAAAGVSLATAGANSVPAVAGVLAVIAATAAISGARAGGGSVSQGGSYMVGERGPELFIPHASGEIVPNDKIGGEKIDINFTINAVDAAGFDALLYKRQGAIINMVRRAQNRRGRSATV